MMQLEAISVHKQWLNASLNGVNICHMLCLFGPFTNDCLSISFSASLMLQLQDMHIRKIAWSSRLSQPVYQCKLSCLFLLPCCTAITGYHASSHNSNSPVTTNDRLQKSKQIATGWESAKKSTTDGIYRIAGKFGRGKVWRIDSFRAFGEREFGKL